MSPDPDRIQSTLDAKRGDIRMLVDKPFKNGVFFALSIEVRSSAVGGGGSWDIVRGKAIFVFPKNQTQPQCYLTWDGNGHSAVNKIGAGIRAKPTILANHVTEVVVQEVLLPVELILDNENNPYDPNTEALGVSNFVTKNGLPGDSQFDATCDDPENFRLQARLLDDKKNTVDVKLEVVRDGATVLTKNYTLDKKDGDIVRGEFLRLVSDDVDDAASGGKKDSDPKDQTILVKLGDTIKVSYALQGDERVEQEIDVGRPANEDNNDASHKKHDTRKVKVRFTVFDLSASNGTPSLPKPKLKSLVEKANAAFAQSGIIVEDVSSDETYGIEPPEEFNEEPIDPETPNVTNYFSHVLGVDLDSPDHQALIPYLDDDPNTIDVFIVKRLGYQSMPVQIDPFSPPIPGQFHHGNATAVPASLGQGKQKNFIIMSATQLQLADFPFRLPHEIMHILLDSGHRVKKGQNMPFGQHPPPLDPATSLFYPTTSPKNEVDGTKRIGPNPEAEAAVGNDDTKNIRKNAEKLPQ